MSRGIKKNNNSKKKVSAPILDDDDDNADEVFNLNIPFGDSDEEEDDSQDEDDEDEDDDEEEDDEEEDSYEGSGELKDLIDNLPQNLRKQVLRRGGNEDDDDDNQDEDENNMTWGSKKNVYWTGDTADLEIGQDVSDAEEEEQAAAEMQRQRLKNMSEEDFLPLEHDDEDEDDDDDDEELFVHKTNKTTTRNVSDDLMGFVTDLRDRVTDLSQRLVPVTDLLTSQSQQPQDDEDDDEVLAFVDTKTQLLLCYVTNLLFYLSVRCNPSSSSSNSLKSHPVMKQMLKLRYAMEKMRGMDGQGRIQTHIDRLLVRQQQQGEGGDSSSSRPNPSSFLNNEEEEDEEIEEKEEKKYRPPKLSATPYDVDGSISSSKDKDNNKNRLKRVRQSELMESLREEFGSRPEETNSSGLGGGGGGAEGRRLQEEAEERIQFEEDRFVRTTLSRREKKDIRKRTSSIARLDNFDDIGDVGDVEQLSKQHVVVVQPPIDIVPLKQMKRPVPLPSNPIPSKQQQQQDNNNEEEDDEDENNLIENFSKQKKEFLSRKQSHYIPSDRFGGIEETIVGQQHKRAVTYEIVKNKGLTPHRKKANRNPRVKKREMYDKKVKARKGQVRDVVTGQAGVYGGETTGIKKGVARSRKIV